MVAVCPCARPGVSHLRRHARIPHPGRDSKGIPYSNITYSTDHGRTWTTGNPAYDDVTECNAAELSDGSIMLNMRDNRNRGHISPNGRRVCTTTDLGRTWTERPTSRKVLTEPTCIAKPIPPRIHRSRQLQGIQCCCFANPAHHKTAPQSHSQGKASMTAPPGPKPTASSVLTGHGAWDLASRP